ncbi:TetR/AcrR family transcriptional regulator [Microbacterium sp. BWT-B31]|uniref:TetR/AcrR family transcriptional regulator n=1 Tax=Microbacterium sp. BWT-B31 TaxID=3232072 RepID=UPI003528A812
MSRDHRTRLNPEERRAQLLALGVAFLADRSLDELTAEKLATRAGVSRGLVFHYFRTLTGLHREIVATARDALLIATAPQPELPPIERLHDTLLRFVAFVREHRGTFYSLVRGVASGDASVREVVDQARDANADRLLDVFTEAGAPDSRLLRVALRSWVGFAEEALVELAVSGDDPADEIVAFLERSVKGVVDAAGGGVTRGGSARRLDLCGQPL